MDILIELLMYVFITIGMITVVICIFEKQIYSYLSKETTTKEEKENIAKKKKVYTRKLDR